MKINKQIYEAAQEMAKIAARRRTIQHAPEYVWRCAMERIKGAYLLQPISWYEENFND